jgi:hypothetical protein
VSHLMRATCIARLTIYRVARGDRCWLVRAHDGRAYAGASRVSHGASGMRVARVTIYRVTLATAIGGYGPTTAAHTRARLVSHMTQAICIARIAIYRGHRDAGRRERVPARDGQKCSSLKNTQRTHGSMAPTSYFRAPITYFRRFRAHGPSEHGPRWSTPNFRR